MRLPVLGVATAIATLISSGLKAADFVHPSLVLAPPPVEVLPPQVATDTAVGAAGEHRAGDIPTAASCMRSAMAL